MGVSIAFARNTLSNPVFTDRLISLTREDTQALIEALKAYEAENGKYSAARLLMEDSYQFGFVGTEVRATVVKSLLGLLSPELAAKIELIVDEAVAAGLTLSIDSGDDDWQNRGPHIAICNEFEGEVSLHWTAGHAAQAFGDLGYKSTDESWFFLQVPAAELKKTAELHISVMPDRDTEALLAVAEFALAKGGAEAMISVA